MRSCILLPDPWWVIGFASFLPVLAAEATAARVNAHFGRDTAEIARFTPVNLLGIVFGAPLVTAVVWIAFFPDAFD